jgi:hypothetical protein
MDLNFKDEVEWRVRVIIAITRVEAALFQVCSTIMSALVLYFAASRWPNYGGVVLVAAGVGFAFWMWQVTLVTYRIVLLTALIE